MRLSSGRTVVITGTTVAITVMPLATTRFPIVVTVSRSNSVSHPSTVKKALSIYHYVVFLVISGHNKNSCCSDISSVDNDKMFHGFSSIQIS